MNKKRLLDYQEQLLLKLQNKTFAAEYLNQTLMDEDPRMFLLALGNILDAQKEEPSMGNYVSHSSTKPT